MDPADSQIWDVISEYDYFTELEGYYIYDIDGREYQVSASLKFPDISNISDSFRQKFTVLLDYVINPENLSGITVIKTQKSEIANTFGGQSDSELLNSDNIQQVLAPAMRKNKDTITAVYLLLQYLVRTPYNHCLVCGCIIDENRAVCHREVCLVVHWQRPNSFTDPLTTYQKLIRLSIGGASTVHLSPKPVEFVGTDDRIAILNYHLMMYDFVDHQPSPVSGYRCLRNVDTRDAQPDCVIGYHGSPIGKWVSILRGGLVNLSGTNHMSTGAVYGKGVYFSKTVGIAEGYSGGGGMIAICEFPEPEIKEPYYVVPDHNRIYIRYLIFRDDLIT